MRMSRPTQLLALALAAAALAPASASADEPPVTEQIIVRYRAGTDAAERADTRADADTAHEEAMRLPNTEVVAVTDGTRAEALAALRADPDVLAAAPNGVAHALTTDPYWSSLYALQNLGTAGRIDADIDAPQAWTVTRGAGVTVGVVDTGVQSDHPDLVGRLDLVNAADYVDGGAPDDGHGHGTHVSGIIAANRNNGIGVTGIAPEATVLPVRALDATGTGDWNDILNAFDWAADHGAKVVNASLGGSYDATLASFFQSVFAAHPSTVFVIAAGNNGLDNDTSPYRSLPCVTSEPNVLCVGASDASDARASYSNYGATTVDLFAPGSLIWSTYKTSLYARLDGTSMATPYVAGTAALVVAQHPLWTGAQIVQQLEGTVDPVAALAGKAVTGGRLNAARAVGATVDPPSQPVIYGTTGGVNTATITMTSRESDVSSYLVYEGASLLKTSSSPTITLGDLAAGAHTFTVVAENTSLQSSPASSPATVTVTDPAPLPTPQPTTPSTPPAERPGTITLPTPTPDTVTDIRLISRAGRKALVFRVNRSARITVAIARLQGTTYRQTASRSLQMAAGLQSLPVTSRLLGMRIPRGRWRVTVGTAAHTASVAFTRR